MMTTKKILLAALACLTLTQCNTLKSDCVAVNLREREIAAEAPGDFYIGRRYYIPYTRFWGYLRRPGQSWRESQLVIMDESVLHTPDRGYEPPVKGATFGKDANVEYTITGDYTGERAYEPSTNKILPVFKATAYTVRNEKPGFLFKPSEEYSKTHVTLTPHIMPRTQDLVLYPAPPAETDE